MKKKDRRRTTARSPVRPLPSGAPRRGRQTPGGHPGVSVQIHRRPAARIPRGRGRARERSLLSGTAVRVAIQVLDRADPGAPHPQHSISTQREGNYRNHQQPPRTGGERGKNLIGRGPIRRHLYVLGGGQKQGANTRQNMIQLTPSRQVATDGSARADGIQDTAASFTGLLPPSDSAVMKHPAGSPTVTGAIGTRDGVRGEEGRTGNACLAGLTSLGARDTTGGTIGRQARGGPGARALRLSMVPAELASAGPTKDAPAPSDPALDPAQATPHAQLRGPRHGLASRVGGHSGQ